MSVAAIWNTPEARIEKCSSQSYEKRSILDLAKRDTLTWTIDDGPVGGGVNTTPHKAPPSTNEVIEMHGRLAIFSAEIQACYEGNLWPMP